MITVVVPVSVIPSHPDTHILDETLDSIRHHLPDAEIMLMFDGVRKEQQHRTPVYDEFVRRALWRADKHYRNCAPFVFDEHLHQVGMLRRVLDEIRTPLLMFVEQDTPLVTDQPIDWAAITDFIQSGQSNLVRLMHEAHVQPEHQHMCHGWDGFTMLRTSQWSQRPHIASAAYYRRILDAHFTPEAKCFIEDVMHGVVDNAYRVDGMSGWLQHRLHLYMPSKENSKRSWHLDGRAGEAKYDAKQIF